MKLEQALEWLKNNAKTIEAERNTDTLTKNVVTFYSFFYRSPNEASAGLFIASVEDYIQKKDLDALR